MGLKDDHPQAALLEMALGLGTVAISRDANGYGVMIRSRGAANVCTYDTAEAPNLTDALALAIVAAEKRGE